MGPAIAFLTFVVIICVSLLVAFLLTRPRHVMNANDRRLYKEAAALLNNMVNVTDLDGDFAKDVISVETRKRIDEWLMNYRASIEKVK